MIISVVARPWHIRCIDGLVQQMGGIVLQRIWNSDTKDKTQIAFNSGLIWFISCIIRCHSHVTRRKCFVSAVTPLLGLIIRDEFVSVSCLTFCNLSQCRPVEKVLLCGEGPLSLSVIMLPEWKQVSHFMFSRPFFSFIYLFASIRSSQIELFLPPVASAEWLTAPGDAEGGKKLGGAADRRTYIVRWHSSAQKVTVASCSKAGFTPLRKTGNWGEIMTPCEVWNVQDISWDWCILILSLAFH